MISRVRKSFIRITMTMLTLVLIVPLISLNLITAAFTYNNTKDLLRQIAETEIFILEPKRMPEHEPPEDEHNIGIGKQQNTSSVTTSATTSSASETITTAVTTVQPPSAITNPPKPNHTETIRTQTTADAVTTTSPAAFTRPPRETFTGTEPNMPPWGGGDYTQPPEPPYNEYTRPQRPEPDNGGQWGHRYYSDGEQVFGDALLDFSGESNVVLLAETFTISNQTAAAATTTTTTTVSETESSSETQIRKKIFHQNFNNRDIPKMMPNNSIDHFIVYIDKSDVVTDVRGNTEYDIESCTELLASFEDKSKYDGYIDSLQYYRKDYSDGAIIVFSNRQSDFDMMKRMALVSSCVFILMEGIVFILTRILTKRAMRPMQISYEKQQQFISDAGHELKTPLTVISANADILSDEIGENKWLSYIKSQAERMRILVQEMLDLTKITNSSQQVPQSRFNLSSLVENVALPFECQAFEQKKTFHIELDPDIEFLGNTERIRRMIGIFIDNAFKYSNENGTIKVILKTENNKKVLKIYNTGIGIKKEDTEKIFERFYRSDSSRSAQGSYGLGLAIAKSIADQHNIKIQVLSDYGKWVSFDLYL